MSVWVDIHKQSNGDAERKEDCTDIDELVREIEEIRLKVESISAVNADLVRFRNGLIKDFFKL